MKIALPADKITFYFYISFDMVKNLFQHSVWYCEINNIVICLCAKRFQWMPKPQLNGIWFIYDGI